MTKKQKSGRGAFLFRVFSLMTNIIVALVAFGAESFAQQENVGDLGRRYPSEKKVEIDKTTGRSITFLTYSTDKDYKPYQTHDTWTADRKWIVFSSNRNKAQLAYYLVNEETGEIVQVTNEKIVTGTANLSRKEMKLYYLRTVFKQSGDQKELVEANLEKILTDSEKSTLESEDQYRRVVAELPNDGAIVGTALDADESTFYLGIVCRNSKGKIPELKEKTVSRLLAVDLKTGKLRPVLNEIPFRIGHVQANPYIPGEIAYCQETGGDAAQRTWIVRSDGTANGPIYREDPMEWVTHETYSGKNELMFILSGLNPAFRVKPTGIAVIDLRSKAVRLLGQTDLKDGLYWHCNGSPDGRFAVGDTHNGKIFLIDRKDSRQILLSTGHPQRPKHLHPIFSPDGRRILIQTGIASKGKSLDLATIPVDPHDK